MSRSFPELDRLRVEVAPGYPHGPPERNSNGAAFDPPIQGEVATDGRCGLRFSSPSRCLP